LAKRITKQLLTRDSKANNTESETMTHEFDYAVIGGGLSGLLIATALSQETERVVCWMVKTMSADSIELSLFQLGMLKMEFALFQQQTPPKVHFVF
jgi:NADH dehydrogenase FAD-containing subunit